VQEGEEVARPKSNLNGAKNRNMELVPRLVP
jgi:hypothetical protein